MVKEDISIKELLEKFDLKLDLPKRLLEYLISSDFMDSDLTKNKQEYIFVCDNVRIIINPKDKTDTVKYLVMDDDNIVGGFVLGYEFMTYLN